MPSKLQTYMPIIVWNNTIVDGHNRYRIAQAHPGIAFRTGVTSSLMVSTLYRHGSR